MYDLHSHLIVGVDDGCKDIEMALALLRQAEEEGILGLITTPHYMNEGRFRKQRQDILPHFALLQQAAKDAGLKIALYLGNEIFCSPSSAKLLEAGKISSMNDSKYVLVEFDFRVYQPDYEEYLYDLAISGYQVILAHVERYQFVQERPAFVYEWIKAGYHIQMNQDSITGKNGHEVQKLSFALLEHNQVHFVCSDAHHSNRTVTLIEANAIVKERYGDAYADELFRANGLAVINNQPIIQRIPRKLEEKKNVIQRLLQRSETKNKTKA